MLFSPQREFEKCCCYQILESFVSASRVGACCSDRQTRPAVPAHTGGLFPSRLVVQGTSVGALYVLLPRTQADGSACVPMTWATVDACQLTFIGQGRLRGHSCIQFRGASRDAEVEPHCVPRRR
jgi:hypothetical protein